MKTEMIKIDRDDMDLREMKRAGEILKKGGLVAFPTETVYGLGGDALDETAAHRIYEAKGRPSDNPLIVHIADMEHLDKIVKYVPESARKMCIRDSCKYLSAHGRQIKAAPSVRKYRVYICQAHWPVLQPVFPCSLWERFLTGVPEASGTDPEPRLHRRAETPVGNPLTDHRNPERIWKIWYPTLPDPPLW